MLRCVVTVSKMGLGLAFYQREIMSDYQRYALYYAPSSQSALGRFGDTWLGRNAETGNDIARLAIDGLDGGEIVAATTSPVRYGFHGTLKPPFALKDGQTRSGLEVAINDLAVRLTPVRCGPLTLKAIGRFLALVPTEPVGELGELAASLVRVLDDFRAPASEAELAKRRSANLTPRQEEMLVAWGYPYVMEEFRFHLTLSGRLPQSEANDLVSRLHAHFAPVIPQPFEVASLALMGERMIWGGFIVSKAKIWRKNLPQIALRGAFFVNSIHRWLLGRFHR